MVFKHFRVNVIARVLLLCTTVLLLNIAIIFRHYAASVLIAALLVYQIYLLITFLETTNRQLSRLFESISYGDFSVGFTTSVKGKAFEQLSRDFNEVVARFREIDMDREESYRYLQAVVQHVGIGVIAFKSDGEVELINTAAKKLFDIPRLGNVDVLDEVSPGLAGTLRSIEPGGNDLVKFTVGGELLQVSIHATELRLRRAMLKLVSFQNIRSELEAKEMEAWQNLIRVLTHEIKNSLTPISSLTSSVEGMLTDREQTGDMTDEAMQDMHIALQTIKKRSEGLLRFTDAYRSLTNIKKPEFERFQVAELVERVRKLAGGQIDEAECRLDTEVDPPYLELTADPQLVEQVLINLILNSVDAVRGRAGGWIRIDASVDARNRIVIEVSDNGRGIIEDAMEKIFVPFFSTKADGSGIGLSISRQIMRLHSGELTVQSNPGERTVFTMRF